MKPYFLIFKANLLRDISYRFNYLFTYLLYITKLLIYLSVWNLIFIDKTEINNYSWNEIASYYTLNTVLSLLFFPSHMFEIQPLIRKGTLNSILIKPINIEANIFAKFLASKVPTFLIMLLLTSLVFFFLDIQVKINFSIFTFSLLILTLLLAFYFGLFVSTFAFWLVEMWPIRRIFQGCMTLFGGIIAPLDLLPPPIASIAAFTPFPYFGYINSKAMQGSLSIQDIHIHCCIALLWIGMLSVSFRFFWKLGLKRYEAVNL